MAKFKRIFILNDPYSLRISGELAKEIGLRESIILLQLEFLVSISDNERDGRKWSYNSTRELKQKYFPWWSTATINRAIKRLLEMKLIIIGNYNKRAYDQTRWFTINFKNVNKLESVEVNWSSPALPHYVESL